MNSLVSLVITLQPTAPATAPAHLGPACQAWFLNRVHAADPALAKGLHTSSQRRPYTVSALQETSPTRSSAGSSRRVKLDPAHPVWLRATTLEPELSAVVLETVLPRLPGTTTTLGGAELTVTGATVDAAAHPWAGRSSYEALVERHLMGPQTPRRTVGLRFASPTTFRRTGQTFEEQRIPDHNQLLPLPELVFGSLAQAWDAFAPVKVTGDVRAFAAACLAVRNYQLKTRLVDDGRSRQMGLLGDCTYQVFTQDPFWLRVLHLLAAFSFFCGVGRGTTAGWGQVRRMKDEGGREKMGCSMEGIRT